MFMQIIQAKVRDSDAARAAMDRWHRELEPGSIGWLGGTYGITDDGTFVAAVRFESEEAARRNSARPEQERWWQEMRQAFSGDVTFHDCRDVTLLLGGGSDDAGFVQVMQGHVRDRERAHELADQATELITKYRPDIMGATIAIDENGFFTETVAFTSEAAAREGEVKEMPPEAARHVEEEMSLLDDLTYLDLHHPWFATHR
ncbi:MAG TPA: hypothetical protein VFG87_22495 [Amycolatopsis sp.]|jgi:hypothetical protein|nr:hypothetical protein [Amycolatopsis sp.]